jgi:biotin-(acetyl-CoA carboxylase) ligase
VCGVLIEIEHDFIIVGIGCNVYQSPLVEGAGADAGRQSTCLWDHCHMNNTIETTVEENNSTEEVKKKEFIHSIGLKLFASVSAWLDAREDTGERVVSDFQRLMTKTPQRLRQTNGRVHEGTEVLPIRINSDGSLEVR